MKIFFKPLIIDNVNNDPYKNDYQLINQNEKKEYNGKLYTKLKYKKNHNFCWRIANAGLAILASITFIPLCLDIKAIGKLWKRVATGEEIKVVLVQPELNPKEDIEKPLDQQPIPHQKNKEEEAKPLQKNVGFKAARAREFEKNAPPAKVADMPSVEMKKF